MADMSAEESYETLMARARRLGMSSPGEVVNYALSLFAQIADEMESGGQLLIHRDREVRELVLQHAARAGCRPLCKVDLTDCERPTWHLGHS